MTKRDTQAREYAAEAADKEAAKGFELARYIAEHLRRDGMPQAAECVIWWHAAFAQLQSQQQSQQTIRGEVTQ